VGIMMLILSVFFLGIDSVFGMVVRWLLKLADLHHRKET
jgi:preprotein translocase subunit SecE